MSYQQLRVASVVNSCNLYFLVFPASLKQKIDGILAAWGSFCRHFIHFLPNYIKQTTTKNKENQTR